MIGNRPPGYRADELAGDFVQAISGQVLAAMVTSMRGLGGQWSTGDLAARLGVTPRTPERQALNEALTARAQPILSEGGSPAE